MRRERKEKDYHPGNLSAMPLRLCGEADFLKRIPREIIGATLFLYSLLVIAHLSLVWVLPYFPTQDGPSHIYNLVILKDLIEGGGEWGKYYDHRFLVAPNLGFIAVAYPLLSLFGPFTVEKLFLSIYLLLMGISVPLFIKAAGKSPFPSSFLLFPVILSYPVMMGFYSYIIGLPLLLISIAFCWKIGVERFWLRLFVFNLVGFVLYWCHSLVFVIFFIVFACATVTAARSISDLLIGVSKLLLVTLLPWICLGMYFFPRLHINGPDSHSVTTLSGLRRQIQNLLMFSMDNFSAVQLLPALAFSLLLIILLWRSIGFVIPKLSRFRELNAFESCILCSVMLLCLMYFLVPESFGSNGLISMRLPVVIVLFLLPILRIGSVVNKRKPDLGVIFGVVGICVVSNMYFIWRESGKVSDFMYGLSVKMENKPVGMTFKGNNLSHRRVDVIKHALSYYGVTRGLVDVGNYEATTDHFQVLYKGELSKLPTIIQIQERPETIDFSRYDTIQYVYGWELKDSDRLLLNRHFEVICEKGRFSIWRRTNSFRARLSG